MILYTYYKWKSLFWSALRKQCGNVNNWELTSWPHAVHPLCNECNELWMCYYSIFTLINFGCYNVCICPVHVLLHIMHTRDQRMWHQPLVCWSILWISTGYFVILCVTNKMHSGMPSRRTMLLLLFFWKRANNEGLLSDLPTQQAAQSETKVLKASGGIGESPVQSNRINTIPDKGFMGLWIWQSHRNYTEGDRSKASCVCLRHTEVTRIGSHFDESLEALVFGQEVLVEVHRFIVAAAESPVNPLHDFPIGPWKLEPQSTREYRKQVAQHSTRM